MRVHGDDDRLGDDEGVARARGLDPAAREKQRASTAHTALPAMTAPTRMQGRLSRIAMTARSATKGTRTIPAPRRSPAGNPKSPLRAGLPRRSARARRRRCDGVGKQRLAQQGTGWTIFMAGSFRTWLAVRSPARGRRSITSEVMEGEARLV